MNTEYCEGMIKYLHIFLSKRENGSTLLWAIGALLVLSIVGSIIAIMSPSATFQVVSDNQKEKAYYAAMSGLNYAMSLDSSAMSALSGTTKTINMTDTIQYKLTVGAAVAGAYPVTSLGTVNSGSLSLANYMVGPVNITPISSGVIPDNPKVPSASFAGATYSYSGNYVGDSIMYGGDFNGGVVIDGSITDLATTGGCLTLQGTRIGKIDGSSVICSNVCIKITGNVSIYGTVISQGNVTVDNGTIYGSISSGGNVTLAEWNGYVKKNGSVANTGNVNYYGSINSEGIKNVEGTITKLAAKPTLCSSYSLPAHEVITPAKADPNYSSTYTFTGTALDDKTTYSFVSLTTGNGADTCFDLSDEGTYINIFLQKNLTFGSSIYIRSSKTENCFDSGNLITSSNYTNKKFTDAAKRIYIDVNGKSTFQGDGHAWVGTLFSKGNIKTEGGFTSVGALYSNGSVDTGGGTSTYYVKSDYANLNW